MKLLVFSHKECWKSTNSPTGWATDGGFAMHMDYLAKLFDQTNIIVPHISKIEKGEVFFTNNSIEILPVKLLFKKGIVNKLFMPFWVIYYLPKFIFQIMKCDAIHAPIPSNIGTIGFLLAHIFNKPLYIRHCGNWYVQRTKAEKFWHWYMEKFAGDKKIFLTTGGSTEAPSIKNAAIKWIFSSSLTFDEISSSNTIRDWNKLNKLCIVCRQEKGKGTEIVIEAIKKLKDNGKINYLDVVGDGLYLSNLKSLVKKFNIENQICFHGKLNHEQVLNVLQQNHFFVYPTNSEGFPKVVLEAMSQGLVVLTTPVSILGKMINDSQAGLILEEKTSDEIINKIQTLVSSMEAVSLMSDNAIQYSKQFTLDRWANEIGKHLENAWNVKLKKA